MKSLVIGASAGLGRALCSQLAVGGHDLYMVASDERDLKPLVSDLTIRFGIEAFFSALDLNDFKVDGLREQVMNAFGRLDNLFYIAGYSSPSDGGQVEDILATKLIGINMTAAVRIINTFLVELKDVKNGNIVGIGSTAAARPRRNNSVYGAAKRGLEFYFGALMHYLAYNPCSIQFYRVGYLDTRMTFTMKSIFPKLQPEIAAKKIILGLGRDRYVRYIPYWWRWVMLVYRSIPGPIHNRLNV